MPKTRFLTWYRLIPLAAVFAFGLISFVYSYLEERCRRLETEVAYLKKLRALVERDGL